MYGGKLIGIHRGKNALYEIEGGDWVRFLEDNGRFTYAADADV